MTDVNTKQATPDTFEITLKFEGAEFDEAFVAAPNVGVFRTEDTVTTQIASAVVTTEKGQATQDKVTFTVTEGAKDFKAGDILLQRIFQGFIGNIEIHPFYRFCFHRNSQQRQQQQTKQKPLHTFTS